MTPPNMQDIPFVKGVASFAFQAGAPVELIKMPGDWKSDSVLLYLTVPLHIRLKQSTQCHNILLISTHQNNYGFWVFGNFVILETCIL